MSNSDSQEDQIDEFLAYTVDDPLVYEEFNYDKAEWANIPSIIPRFITFMSKHLEALTQKCNERFSQVSTPALQAQMEDQINALKSRIDLIDSSGEEKRTQLAAKVNDIQRTTTQIVEENKTKQLEQEQQCKMDLKQVIPTPTEEDYVREFEKDERLANEEVKDEYSKGTSYYLV